MHDEAALVNLDKLDKAALRPEFKEGVRQLIRLIIAKAHPKRFGTSVITGPIFAGGCRARRRAGAAGGWGHSSLWGGQGAAAAAHISPCSHQPLLTSAAAHTSRYTHHQHHPLPPPSGLAEAYVKAINEGAVPTIATAWQGVAEAECRRAADAAEAAYVAAFDQDLVAEEGALEAEHARCLDAGLQVFAENAVGARLAGWLAAWLLACCWLLAGSLLVCCAG